MAVDYAERDTFLIHENVINGEIWKTLLINLIKDHIIKYQENNKSYDILAQHTQNM
jgi:hypothetical protein